MITILHLKLKLTTLSFNPAIAIYYNINQMFFHIKAPI